jgi:hyperosmotically inducible protein
MRKACAFMEVEMSKILWSSLLTLGAAAFTGCAVTDRQSSVGAYVDDTAITTQVKSKFAEDPAVSAMRIGVETLQGTVQLSGFATTETEKQRAAQLARNVSGVREVRNNIVVRAAGG